MRRLYRTLWRRRQLVTATIVVLGLVALLGATVGQRTDAPLRRQGYTCRFDGRRSWAAQRTTHPQWEPDRLWAATHHCRNRNWWYG